MTLEHLESECQRAEDQIGRYGEGVEPFIVLKLNRPRLPSNPERIRLLPGVLATVMGTMRNSDGSFRLVVRAKTADVRRFIAKERATAAARAVGEETTTAEWDTFAPENRQQGFRKP